MDTLRSGWATTVLKSIGDAVIATDADARVVFMNRMAEELTGWSYAEAEGLLSTDILLIIDERTGQREHRPIREAIAQGQAISIPRTSLLVSRSGRQIPIEDIASPITDDAGEVTGCVMVFRDITGRRQGEKALEEANRRHEALLESIADGFVSFDSEWRYTYFNAALEKMSGFRREVVLGKRLWDVFPDLVGSGVEAGMRQALATGKPVEYESHYERWGKWFLDRYYPTSEGGITAYVTDITDRKRTQDELSRRMQELQAIFDAAPVGINVAEDPECRIIRGNRVLAELLGLASGENVSKSSPEPERATYSVFADGRELEPHELPMQRAASDGIELWGQLLEVQRADSSRITVLMNAVPIRDDDGRIRGAVGICVDVTQLKAAEGRLRDADRRKDEFLAMLAHELRNPLAAVGNAVTVLKMSNDPENISFAKDVIERQTRQLGRLIDDLLDVSRITSGKIRLKRELCDAGPILKQAIESVEPLIKERKHHLVTDFNEGTLPLRADPTRVEQIVVNLLTNAAKYAENGGTIHLAAKQQGDEIVITLRDTGVGIPPEKLPQMFELFAQGERSIARSEGGLGIGLTIVQKLSEMHGGSVTAKSEGAGKGSTFTVRLPAGPLPASSPAESEFAAQTRRRGSRILVVDDNHDTARGLVRLLKLLGNDAIVAHDGPSAIDAARIRKPDYILLDIGLPGMDGYEVARRLREEPCCRASVIIAISGYGQDEDRRRSREAGFDHHLVKPVDFDKLLALLSQSV